MGEGEGGEQVGFLRRLSRVEQVLYTGIIFWPGEAGWNVAVLLWIIGINIHRHRVSAIFECLSTISWNPLAIIEGLSSTFECLSTIFLGLSTVLARLTTIL